MQNQTNPTEVWGNDVKSVHTMRDLSKLIPKQEVQQVQEQPKQSYQLRTPEWHVKHAKLRVAMAYYKKHPHEAIAEVARSHDVNLNSLYSAIYSAKAKASKKMAKARAAKAAKVTNVTEKPWSQPELTTSATPLKVQIIDVVNHPEHYKTGGIETIDFIEAKQLTYNLGNVVKYITRAGVKNKATHIEDLEKAAWYLNREIENLKK